MIQPICTNKSFRNFGNSILIISGNLAHYVIQHLNVKLLNKKLYLINAEVKQTTSWYKEYLSSYQLKICSSPHKKMNLRSCQCQNQLALFTLDHIITLKNHMKFIPLDQSSNLMHDSRWTKITFTVNISKWWLLGFDFPE